MFDFLNKTDIFNNLQNLTSYANQLKWHGLIEIIILTIIIYNILNWLKNTRAFTLLRGIVIILLFYLLMYALQFSVILFILQRLSWIVLLGMVVIFQNDIRQALEHLGRQKWFLQLIPDAKQFTKKTNEKSIQEIIKATFEMAKVKTGALMVIEQKESLENIEKTGILIDGKISSGLLINIFEKNTPLHDGAVLIVGDLVKAATCYLPLSENLSISKSLGTRHRAALGISEVSDSITIIVSEETGSVTVAYDGKLNRMKDEVELANFLIGNNDEYKKNVGKTMVNKVKGWFVYEKNS